jgi:leader peptidase (prepilin peptidase)/N-methyltransferase
MSAVVGALCAAGGGVAALAWDPLEPALTARARSSDELLEQPGWTRAVTRRWVLVAVSAIACGAAGWRLGATRELIPALVLAVILVGMSAIDFRYRIIPDLLTVPLVVAGVALGAALRFDDLPELGAAAVGAGLFLLIAALLVPAGMGLGDVKLVFALGLFLGRNVLVAIIVGLLAVVIPTIAVLPSRGLRARKMMLPLGPFLAFGAMVAVLWGDAIVDWYTGS